MSKYNIDFVLVVTICDSHSNKLLSQTGHLARHIGG